ncbi:hypothetical protein FGG08_003998 [Glutinoglossum americanum]|uniref:Plasma membrane iron permease n=1 Tax=Glutinoglossum americanum TaxID=1670608 RepID=A0A9P8L2X5_9PEZI|nr:hypothetical protein FGG08_003998 [Glutinoglossum americanum]
MVNVFFLPVFFIVFRETLETSIIVSVLLAFLKRTLGPEMDPVVYKKLVRQVWLGTGVGLFICVAIGVGMIGAFYRLGANHWAGTESLWEGCFALIASLVISLMGAALLRVSKLQDKWRLKLAKALEANDNREGGFLTRLGRWTEKYAMFLLPFITVLREGLEAVVFIGGVGLGQPASAFPLPVLCGLLGGTLIGWAIYRGSNLGGIQIFLIVSTSFLYLVAAGLLSRAVIFFEMNEWRKITGGGEVDETGAGPGSYNIRQSVWHVNCCSPGVGGGGGWGVFNSLFGWTNSATYGSVISYNLYWIAVSLGFFVMRYKEKTGHWPLIKPKATDDIPSPGYGDNIATEGVSKEIGVISQEM